MQSYKLDLLQRQCHRLNLLLFAHMHSLAKFTLPMTSSNTDLAMCANMHGFLINDIMHSTKDDFIKNLTDNTSLCHEHNSS